jgi:hypothetical protein
MNEFAVLAAVAALVLLFVLAEVIAAVLPLIIVVTLVPPEQRRELAELLAACDSSRRLRIWPALRAAVRARRQTRDRNLNVPGDREASFDLAQAGGPINAPRTYDQDLDRSQNPAGPRLTT